MKNNSWVITLKPNPQAKIKLYCFPYSGASASVFYPWIEILPPIFEVHALQLPGHSNRISEPLHTNIQQLIYEFSSVFQPEKNENYALFGHSLGSLICFEYLRFLRRGSFPMPKMLFVSGHGGPQIPDCNPQIHQLNDLDFHKKLREINGMTDDVLNNEELMELLTPIIRADFEICEKYIYKPEPPFDFPIIAFGGLEDPFVSKKDLEGWQEHTTQRFSVRLFPGDHFYLQKSRMLLLQVISRELSSFI
jgi:medium-chain acyl-[acyl-carrier-protein] hydrolase